MLCEEFVLKLLCVVVDGELSVGELEGSRCGEGVVEVLEEIVHILDSHAETDQVLWHGACCAHLGRDTGMRHATWHTIFS